MFYNSYVKIKSYKMLNIDLELFLRMLTSEEKSHLVQLISVESMDELSRFENGRYCPHCGNTHPVKRGVVHGRQRYFCSDCHKYFTVYAKTILNYTKKSILTWKMFIKLMLEPKPVSLEEISKQLNICRRTAFNWRHKVLRVLEEKFMKDSLKGVIEADETFVLSARKGVHVEGIKGRKRGGASKYRGLSHEQTGILVALDRSKNIVSSVYGCGKISGADVNRVLSNRIEKGSLLITDGCKAYVELAAREELELKQLKGGRSVGSGIHLNTVNNYHSILKRWLFGFNGISTKYLNRYMSWFKFIQQKNDCGFLFNNLILK